MTLIVLISCSHFARLTLQFDSDCGGVRIPSSFVHALHAVPSQRYRGCSFSCRRNLACRCINSCEVLLLMRMLGVVQDTDRDFFMGAEEAVEYGLIDAVISRPQLIAATNGASP